MIPIDISLGGLYRGGEMKILHTSDWHLGRALYGKARHEEFEAFLDWLAEIIELRDIDVLLVAGDIFDTNTPSHRAQALYYQFLCRVAASPCRHIVIIAGNHDSPSFLNAPKELLKALDVHVVGGGSADLNDEVLVLCNQQQQAELIVCAVPYLRDRDIRTATAGESIDDKNQKLLEGIRNHYVAVAELAVQKRQCLEVNVPIIAMGHLFTAGGTIIDGDGVRDLYVGSTPHVASSIFSPVFDYVALGHLHVPQKVNNTEHIRYSGSPIPMGFGEAKQQKSICELSFDVSTQEGSANTVTVELIQVPVFQMLESIKGDWCAISSRVAELSAAGAKVWLEIIYEGDELLSDLRERVDLITADTALEVLRIKNNRVIDRILEQRYEEEMLDDLTEHEVFERCLDAHSVPDHQRSELVNTYQETLLSLIDDDSQAV